MEKGMKRLGVGVDVALRPEVVMEEAQWNMRGTGIPQGIPSAVRT
jgi:hypothetical protein